ncbi:hypothetical protein M8J77_005820 [Diaphorina citri]|nr:hypothetical protein M8J77_005820 [Diaphorina citri]
MAEWSRALTLNLNPEVLGSIPRQGGNFLTKLFRSWIGINEKKRSRGITEVKQQYAWLISGWMIMQATASCWLFPAPLSLSEVNVSRRITCSQTEGNPRHKRFQHLYSKEEDEEKDDEEEDEREEEKREDDDNEGEEEK